MEAQIIFDDDDDLNEFINDNDTTTLTLITHIVLLKSFKYQNVVEKLINLESLVIYKGFWTKLPDKTFNTKLTQLVISNNQISRFNKVVNVFQHLETLILDNNNIYILPSSLYEITTLQALSLNENNIQVLSSKVSNLVNLTYLSLSHNKLTSLPKTLWSLEKLEYLNLNCNKLANIKLAKNAKVCDSLLVFKLAGNKLANFPNKFANMKKLEHLYLDNNALTDQSLEILYNFTNLKTLSITCNHLTKFNCIFTNLQTLGLSINNLETFDEKIFGLSSLKYLYICNIPSILDKLDSYKAKCEEKHMLLYC